jgi:hypothetical protein
MNVATTVSSMLTIVVKRVFPGPFGGAIFTGSCEDGTSVRCVGSCAVRHHYGLRVARDLPC